MFVSQSIESKNTTDPSTAEEIKDASVIVPKSMVWSFLLNVPFTFGVLITYLFCIGDVQEAIRSATGFPFIYVFYNATGTTAAATVLTLVILILVTMITTSSLASTSRQTFAFARDNGLPFSKWLARVSPHFHLFMISGAETPLFYPGSSLIPGPGKLDHLYMLIYHDFIPHQHRLNRCVQCHTLAFDDSAHGNLHYLYWMCDCKTDPRRAIPPCALEPRTIWVRRQHHRACLRMLGLLLELLAEQPRRHRGELQLGVRTFCWALECRRRRLPLPCTESV